MRLVSWLVSYRCHTPKRSGRPRQRTAVPACIELLEPRTLLSAMNGRGDGLPGSFEPTPGEYGRSEPGPVTSGFNLTEDDEDTVADEPVQVTGTFLQGPNDRYATDPTDVLQGSADTCAISSVLAAVAGTSWSLEDGLVPIRTGGKITGYKVRLFEPNAQGIYKAAWKTVAFNGTLTKADPAPTDGGEYWVAMYTRAFVQQQNATLDGNYRTTPNAFRALTGFTSETFDPTFAFGSETRTQALRIKHALDAGRPIVAGTIDVAGDPLLIPGGGGVIANHAYTLTGIEVPASGNNIYVTLRNPWGHDTTNLYFDADGDGTLNTTEWVRSQKGLDSRNDGFIRLPWYQFASSFETCVISAQTGPRSINRPITAPPVFANPRPGTSLETPFVVHEGERITIPFRATDPEGVRVDYFLTSRLGEIHTHSGDFTWEPRPYSAGITYAVTVEAEASSPLDVASQTVFIKVLSGRPHVGGLTANPGSISDDATQLLTLTTSNVTSDFGSVSRFDYYLDVNNNDRIDSADRYLRGDGGASWTGYVGGLTPGAATFLVRAVRYSFSDTFYSDPVSARVSVTAAPRPPVAAVPVGPQRLATDAGSTTDRYAFRAVAPRTWYGNDLV